MQIYRTWGQTFITQLVCLYYRCDIPCEWALALWKNAVLWPTWGQRAQSFQIHPMVTLIVNISEPFFFFCFPKIIYIEKIEVVMHIFQIYLWLLHTQDGARLQLLEQDMTICPVTCHRFPFSQTWPETAKAGTFLRKDLWGWSQRVRTGN